ncbi:MAG TPA: hypothetical protein DCF33_16915 [Saprospirales bacterium]|nr:hypothetical protein [Saprospirales bacterium]
MNKKLFFAGVLAIAGFIGLTAFDGKTLAQQKEEIAAAVTAKLETLRSEKAAECDARVQTEATTRFETWKAEQAAAPAAPAPKKGAAKKGGSKGPKVDPLPAPPPPAKTDPKSTKMEGGSNTDEKAKKMEGAPANTDKKKAKMGGGN